VLSTHPDPGAPTSYALRTSAGQGNGGTRVATTTEHSYKALNARVILLLIECVSLIAYGKRVVASAREAEMLSGAPRGPLATTQSKKTWPKNLAKKIQPKNWSLGWRAVLLNGRLFTLASAELHGPTLKNAPFA
jgi:hypothetical protein